MRFLHTCAITAIIAITSAMSHVSVTSDMYAASHSSTHTFLWYHLTSWPGLLTTITKEKCFYYSTKTPNNSMSVFKFYNSSYLIIIWDILSSCHWTFTRNHKIQSDVLLFSRSEFTTNCEISIRFLPVGWIVSVTKLEPFLQTKSHISCLKSSQMNVISNSRPSLTQRNFLNCWQKLSK